MRAGKVEYGHKVDSTLIPASFYPQFLSDGYVAHLGQLEAGSHSHPPQDLQELPWPKAAMLWLPRGLPPQAEPAASLQRPQPGGP